MCGLCGVLSPELTNDQEEVFQDLMVVSTLRGPWGAGLAAVPAKGNKSIELLRSAEFTAAELVHTGKYYQLYQHKAKYKCLAGHARWPTSGGNEITDIHPHTHGDVIGFHNGTMTFVNGSPVTKNDSDSAMLIEAISTTGIVKTLNASKGAYALVLLNKSAGTISFVRNDARTLYFAKAGTALYWASELGMLQLVLGRKSFLKNVNVEYKFLHSEVLLTFRLHNIGAPEILSHIPLEKKEETSDPTVRYRTCGAATFPRDELNDILTAGCSNCVEPASYDDWANKTIHFYKPKEFMCDECLTHDATAQAMFLSYGVRLPDKIKPFVVSH